MAIILLKCPNRSLGEIIRMANNPNGLEEMLTETPRTHE